MISTWVALAWVAGAWLLGGMLGDVGWGWVAGVIAAVHFMGSVVENIRGRPGQWERT